MRWWFRGVEIQTLRDLCLLNCTPLEIAVAFDYLPIINGQRRDPLAHLSRLVLWVVSLGYRVVVRRRNRRFEADSSASHAAGVPVVSVGNLTTGGTGKTPIVCYLAAYFRKIGVRVAIVSRGYGRGEADANDEALELYDRLPDVPHLQDPDRVAAAAIAVEELEAELILMDDGFQHRRLRRDLDIVAIDATNPFGFGHCLPRGLLREPIEGLQRAHAVLLTRCDQVGRESLERITAVVRETAESLPVIRTEHVPCALFEYPENLLSLNELKGQRVAILCAIGNPEAFASTIRKVGADVVASRQLTDHDPYEPETVEQLRNWVTELGTRVDQVICTHKDLVKLRTDRLGGRPLRALQIDLRIVDGESELLALLEGLRQNQVSEN